ncbi:MAG: hypothetical protein GY827_02145 [Cytophagales bacterium]|nr:hypothetical protein [Cytophagales bacterium]
MKRQSFLFFLLSFISILSFGQVPQLINYQAIARDIDGRELPNFNISVNIAITEGQGNVLYEELHDDITTNEFGLFTLKIGGGTPTSQDFSFSSIDWSGEKFKFVRVAIDFDKNGIPDLISETQLLSVPFALQTVNADTAQHLDNETLTITDGNVGIGSPFSPTERLHILNGNILIEEGNLLIAEGRLGINTELPATALHLKEGSLFIESVDGGIYLKSNNGNCYFLSIDNNGALQVVQRTCP